MHNTPLTCAYSSCPNDTFIFCRIAQDADIESCIHDVETLNQRAFKGEFDITKLSFHAWLLLQDTYEILQSGAALGRGCGPLVISRNTGPLTEEAVIAVPGEHTTAHLLLRLWRPDLVRRVFMPFDRIMDAVASGKADAGVIIHEGRFVYKDRGFEALIDLGDWWEGKTGLPIPLGCIAVRKSLGAARIAEIDERLRQSIQAAFDDPASTRDYVKAHAQELDETVIEQHIRTYVNDYSLNLGEEGAAAIATLKQLATAAGVIP